MSPEKVIKPVRGPNTAAVALLAVYGLAMVAVFGYTPGATPANTRNLLCPSGDWLARTLFDAIGHATYLLLAAWFALVVLIFMNVGKWKWTQRLIGTAILIPTD